MITYCHEAFIREAIEGILMQECNFEVELIVANDCSPDNTDAIVNEIIHNHQKSNWIKYTKHNVNKGMCLNFIWALEQSQGKYIAICEGDDYWTDPLKLQKQVDFLKDNKEYVITYARAQPFDDTGLINKKTGSERDLSNDELIKCIGINTLTVCFRNIINKYPEEMKTAQLGDLFLWSLLGHYGKGKFLEEIKHSMYRVHSGGAFSMQNLNKKKEMWFSTSHALYTYYYRLRNDKYKKHFEESFLRSAISHIGYKSSFKIFFRRLFLKIKDF